MDLPPPVAKINFNNISKAIAISAKDAAKVVLKEAGERLFNITMDKYPENIELDGRGKMIGNVDVSVDGTWQRRGHTSKIGVVFVISVETGEVLDYVVKSLICHECVSRSNVDRNSDYFKNWFDIHKDT